MKQIQITEFFQEYIYLKMGVHDCSEVFSEVALFSQKNFQSAAAYWSGLKYNLKNASCSGFSGPRIGQCKYHAFNSSLFCIHERWNYPR